MIVRFCSGTLIEGAEDFDDGEARERVMKEAFSHFSWEASGHQVC